MKQLGIIGNPLEHSWSADMFNAKFEREGIDALYALYPIKKLNERTLGEVVRMNRLSGFNVTIPYKKAIIPMLDGLSETARRIGAVNVVKVEWKGEKYRLTGYNTDYIGFMESLLPLLKGCDLSIRKALVLGTGGAAHAVRYALEEKLTPPWEVVMVSRTMDNRQYMTYRQLTAEIIREYRLIVNCTPVGMYPSADDCPAIPYEAIDKQHILFDCIYNPEETMFLRKGRERGAKTLNGMQMLEIQAREAWKKWNEF